jgi:uncharacterized protein
VFVQGDRAATLIVWQCGVKSRGIEVAKELIALRIAREGPVVVTQREVALVDLPEQLCGFRIAHVSDMHFSRWDRVCECAQRLLLSLDYDAACLTGDFGDFRHLWERSLGLAERFLAPVVDRKPVYATLGNHDSRKIALEMKLAVRWLHNEGVVVGEGDAAFYLAGVDQNVAGADDVAAAVSGNKASLPMVLMAHYPSTVYRLPDDRIDLVLSGHTHGGQIRLPFIGCVWPNDAIPREMARGLHRVGRTMLHVSPGLGTSLPVRVRFLCPAEITVLKLVRKAVSTAEGDREHQPETVSAGVPV